MAKVSFGITIKNEAEVRKAIQAMGKKVEDVLEAAMIAGAETLIQAADSRAPAPGNILHETVDKSRKKVTVHVGPSSKKWYYRLLEKGLPAGRNRVRKSGLKALKMFIDGRVVYAKKTKGFPARPFLRPAVDERKEKISAEAGEIIKKAVGGK